MGASKKENYLTVLLKRPFQIISFVRNWYDLLADYLGLLRQQEKVYILRNGAKFLARTGSKDKSMILEIWIDKCYTPNGFEIRERDLVVDIGSHIGTFSIYAAQRAKLGTVYSIEPVVDNFELLKQNLGLNNLENCVPIQKAITGRSGKRQIFVQQGDTTMHSFYNPKGRAKKTVVGTLSLGDLIKYYKIDFIDFLKMDCEGTEYEILFSTEDENFDKIGRISMESHPIDASRNVGSMKSFLESKGFEVKTNSNFGTLYARKHTKKGNPN